MIRSIVSVIVVAACTLISTVSPAQDAHYWTLQYGPKSTLLGGAVVGSTDDVSATFYNPGALSRATNLSFAVSASIFEVRQITLEDGGGTGVDLGDTKSGLLPSMIAGTISDSLFGAGVLAYSAINRTKGSQESQVGLVLSGDQLPPSAGLEDLVGTIRIDGDYSDFWAGLTYSHRIGSGFGAGITLYGASRSQTRRETDSRQTIDVDGSGQNDYDLTGGSYSSIRTLAKVGFYGRLGGVTGGFSVTSPSLHLYGRGQIATNRGSFGPDSTVLAAGFETGLNVTYKTPLSVGAGVGIPIGSAKLHVSGEWYDRIDPYVVMQTEFEAQAPSGTIVNLDVIQELDAVLNWATALEFSMSRKFTGYLALYTNNSGVHDQIKTAGLSLLPVDIKNASFGADFRVGPALLNLGIAVGWGSEIAHEFTDLIDETDLDIEATYVFRSYGILFGFEIGV
jgi:hypothetical protein